MAATVERSRQLSGCTLRKQVCPRCGLTDIAGEAYSATTGTCKTVCLFLLYFSPKTCKERFESTFDIPAQYGTILRCIRSMVKNELRPNYGHIALWSQYLIAFAPGAALTSNAGVAAGAALTFRPAPEARALICVIFEGRSQKPRCSLWPIRSQTPSVPPRDSQTMIAEFQAGTGYL